MQFEVAHPSCPLCMQPLPVTPAGLASDTRLCDQCRTIVQTAFPGAVSRVAASPAAVQNNGSIALGQQGATTSDRSQVVSSAFFEDDLRIVESLEKEPQSPMSFEPYDEFQLEIREHEDFDRGAPGPKAVFPDLLEEGSGEPQVATSIDNVEAKLPDTDFEADGYSQPAEQPGTLTEPVAVSASLSDDRIEQSHRPDEHAAATDPWDDPLPAWDYSQNEWPVLVVGPPRERSFKALGVTLAALVFLAGAVGFYFLIYQGTSGEQRQSISADSGAIDRAPAAVEPQASTARPADSDPQNERSPAYLEAPASADSKPNQVAEERNASRRFSLQAAAFPTQAAADEFAEKLRRASLASYVVSTDLGRRGRWFRVRVGRFPAADDAQRFAAEAQVRANAAGVSLQLIVCQYEQP